MPTQKKQVYCLYRVSTAGQVEKDDIPMQRQACREFSATQGWEIVREFSEKGVSGFKVSAKDRDVICEIQKDAAEHKFDILLVFMFDRIGRKEDETPFVVEWFTREGVEVWSVHEGQQRFDTHVDKLMNYIRYWQASGESIKTSIRTKTRLSQIVQEGRFRGGVAPYGYRLERQGRINKKNREVYELVIHEEEAGVVQKIYDLYMTHGYGSQRISTYLTESGILNRNGNNFTNTTIQNMLKNKTYIGVLKSGETQSEIFPHLQIIPPDVHFSVQEIIQQRSAQYKERNIPLNTRGRSLLSGNVFCGHCGARLVVTTNGKKYIRKSDGEITFTPRTRYVCYNRRRHPGQCDGQTGYTSRKLDTLIDGIIHRIFASVKNFSKDQLIETQFQGRMETCQLELANAKASLRAHTAEMKEYEAEVIKVIRGESRLDSNLLNKLYDEAKEKNEKTRRRVEELELQLSNGQQTITSLSDQFDNLTSWAELYDQCEMDSKKMILSQIFKSIKVRSSYEIEVELNVTCEQLGLQY